MLMFIAVLVHWHLYLVLPWLGGVSPPAAMATPAASTPNPIHNHVLDDSSSDAKITAVSPDATVAASPLVVFTLSGENE